MKLVTLPAIRAWRTSRARRKAPLNAACRTGRRRLGAGSTNPLPTTIPESAFLLFQMAFAIITPAVVTGAFADRMKFSALLLFVTPWSLLVYAPVAHWVWSPTGWLSTLGIADFAGGTRWRSASSPGRSASGR
jgi:ammonia channel protein AmtB